MRVLVLTHNYPRAAGDPAGAFVARLARAAHAAGHRVLVVAPHARAIPSEEEIGGVSVRRFRYAPERLERVGYTGALHGRALASPLVVALLPSFLVAFRRAARRAVREFAPDVIHAHWWLPAGLMALGLGVPTVLTCHGSDVRLLERAPVLRPLARRVAHGAAAVTAVSRFLARDLAMQLALPEHSVLTTPMPVDTSHFATGARSLRVVPPRILYAGNLVRSKGVDVLLDAFARLRGRGVDCGLRVLGAGPEERALRAQADRLGVAGAVSWSGFVSQDAMPAEYGASTVTVLPSRGQAEGLGLSLVEALLAGSAVVATAAGGIPEVVTDEETGLIARDGDPDDLARQLERVLHDRALRERLVERGRAHVTATFSEGPAAARVLALYDQIRDHRDAA